MMAATKSFKEPNVARRSKLILVLVDGMSRFELKDGLISDYSESVNGGVAMVQLWVQAPRIEKVLQRWSKQLHERPASQAFLARAGRAKA